MPLPSLGCAEKCSVPWQFPDHLPEGFRTPVDFYVTDDAEGAVVLIAGGDAPVDVDRPEDLERA